MNKQDAHIIKGMQKDISVSKYNSEFAFDAQNIRITAKDNNTLLSITNEKGNKEITIDNKIEGTVIGKEVINNYLVLFTTDDDYDKIYRLEKIDDSFSSIELYKGNLEFDVNYPIESLAVFENDDIQKVYWIDNKNQPRVINITASEETRNMWDDNSFDFIQELTLLEEVTIKRNELSSGLFAPGVIQYAFTYYNKYGQESNIFYTSALNYISSLERGSSPEDRVSNSFDITINNVDTRFEYIRIYSIHRTSIDATPTVLKVVDLPVAETIKYTDNGSLGATVDPTELLYIGGESVIAGTMTQKDNTLFLGNITLNRESIPKEIKDSIEISKNIIINNSSLKTSLREVSKESNFRDGYYKYTNFLSEGNTSGFKSGEHYRLGIQFQHKTGKWSEPVFIGDYRIDENVRPDNIISENISYLLIPQIEYSLDKNIVSSIKELGYKKARAVVVLPTTQDKRILVQGMICPTVFNVGNRNNNTPFSQSSWFLRPFLPWNVDFSSDATNNDRNIDNGAWVEFRHHYGLFNGNNRGAEIQNISHFPNVPYNLGNINNDVDTYSNIFMVDQSILTLHSPDIEFDTSIQSLDYAKLQMRIVGAINFTASIGDIDIQTSSPVVHPTKATGFIHKTLGSTEYSALSARSLVSGLFYKDWLVDDRRNDEYNYYDKQKEELSWMVYPWQKSGSINNDINTKNRTRSSVLLRKKISNLKFSSSNTWFDVKNYWNAKDDDIIHNGITNVQLFNNNEVALTKIPIPEHSVLSNINYYGNIDTLLGTKEAYSQYVVGGVTDDSSIPNTEGWKKTTFYDSDFKTVSDIHRNIGDYNENLTASKDPVRMKYKSTPHFVFGLNYTAGTNSQVILPTTYGSIGSPVNKIADSVTPFWIKDSISRMRDAPYIVIRYVDYFGEGEYPQEEWEDGQFFYNLTTNTLYIYRSAYADSGSFFPFDTVNLSAYKTNTFIYNDNGIIRYYNVIWHDGKYILEEYANSEETPDVLFEVKQDVISETITYPYLFLAELYREDSDLVNSFGGTSEDAIKNNLWLPAGEPVLLDNQDTTIKYTYGDTWYQRYDCLKTYPFTLEDENSIVEIGSFMCETRVNIDGRYDRNRGQISNLVMTPNNFNKINKVYTQKNNFFNYRVLDDDFYTLSNFPNTITWTKEKSLGADVDTWTNITMASTLDLDGDKGEVTALKTFNNEIFSFQNKGISNIMFNSRVQIPTSDGTPIEITNGLKVLGKKYISTIGCNNKWSIVTTPSGLYFIDNTTDGIYLFNGQQVASLSESLSMGNWVSENTSFDNWNPVDFNNFISHYDSNGGDIYFVNKNTALVYSEILGQFTSFMNYEKTPYMFNICNSFYAIKDNKVWEQFAGEYNSFYGNYKPYSVTIISNADTLHDKIFNTVEFRADTWNNETLLNEVSFDTLEVWNEYQKGISDLKYLINTPSSLKRKFRIWRANIPRSNVDWNGVTANKLDRIRNTWAYVKLSMNKENTWRTELHDIVIHYFI